MIEEFSGSIKCTEVLEPSSERVTPVGLLLRPTDDWRTPITVGKQVKLVFPDGRCYLSRVRGGEIMTPEQPGMLIEFIPELDNKIPEGTRVYILND